MHLAVGGTGNDLTPPIQALGALDDAGQRELVVVHHQAVHGWLSKPGLVLMRSTYGRLVARACLVGITRSPSPVALRQ